MIRHKSAVKQHRQAVERRTRNRNKRGRLRSLVKRLRLAIAEGNAESARTLLPEATSLLDRTAKTRAIHPNAASRQKSRLTKAVQAIGS